MASTFSKGATGVWQWPASLARPVTPFAREVGKVDVKNNEGRRVLSEDNDCSCRNMVTVEHNHSPLYQVTPWNGYLQRPGRVTEGQSSGERPETGVPN